MKKIFSVFLFFLFTLVACQNSPTTGNVVTRGQAVYQANCTSCHAADPTQVGPVGPAIAGSSRELIEARVLHASYPPNYSPQRVTHIMPAMPFLAKDMDALVAYLSPKK